MTEELTVTEAVRNFAEYINRVVYRRESFVLFRGGKAVAEMKPLPSGKRLGDLPDLLASLPRLTSDEAAAFGNDIDRARDELARQEVPSPWES